MDFTQYGPVFARLVDAQSNDAHFEFRIELGFGNAVRVEAGDDKKVVRKFFQLVQLWRFAVAVEKNFDVSSQKSEKNIVKS